MILSTTLSTILKRSIILMLILLTLDQFSKHWIVVRFKEFDSLQITSFFSIVRAHNPGAAFSFLADAGGWQHYFFTSLALIVCTYLLWEMRKAPNDSRLCTAYSLVVCGAIGNVIDRLRFGYVIDFLDIHIGTAHWPAFNVADSAICIGVALLIIDEFTKLRTVKKIKN